MEEWNASSRFNEVGVEHLHRLAFFHGHGINVIDGKESYIEITELLYQFKGEPVEGACMQCKPLYFYFT